MRLTRKNSIELCIELWTWLAKTGKEKGEYVFTEEHAGYCKRYEKEPCSLCWFCEYGSRKVGGWRKCESCPIKEDGPYQCLHYTAYGSWERSKQTRTRKKYAKLFLAQIKAL